ncbi:MAG: hypothetical protein KJ955_02730 [Nanoarchaeota archaeon]|nr:hypothetical protein [Nanoarchaeota archaeon]
MTTLRSKIGDAIFYTGFVIAVGSVCGSSCLEIRAERELTTGARYVQMVEADSEFASAYPQADELYQQLKAEPRVQKAISNHDEKKYQSNKAVVWGLPGSGCLIVASYFISRKKEKKKEEKK